MPETTILLVEVGSTAHGTGLPDGEDRDELGVVVDTPEQVLGLDERGFVTDMQRTQPEGVRSGPGDVDRTLRSLPGVRADGSEGQPVDPDLVLDAGQDGDPRGSGVAGARRWLRAVRTGEVSFDEWWERSLELDARLEALQLGETLPLEPDAARIDSWLVEVHCRLWARQRAGSEDG